MDKKKNNDSMSLTEVSQGLIRTPIRLSMVDPNSSETKQSDYDLIEFLLRKVLIRDLQAMANREEDYDRNPENIKKLISTLKDIGAFNEKITDTKSPSEEKSMEGLMDNILEKLMTEMYLRRAK